MITARQQQDVQVEGYVVTRQSGNQGLYLIRSTTLLTMKVTAVEIFDLDPLTSVWVGTVGSLDSTFQ